MFIEGRRVDSEMTARYLAVISEITARYLAVMSEVTARYLAVISEMTISMLPTAVDHMADAAVVQRGFAMGVRS